MPRERRAGSAQRLKSWSEQRRIFRKEVLPATTSCSIRDVKMELY